MKHLTTVRKPDGNLKSYALFISIPPEQGEAISKALDFALGNKINKKSAFVCQCVLNGAIEPIMQRRVKHALDDLAVLRDIHGEDMPAYAIDLVKILTGCPTDTAIEFVGESDEYREFWKEQANE